MTKKDYVLIANVIKLCRESKETLYGLTIVLSRKLKEQNPRFNMDKFEKACGIAV